MAQDAVLATTSLERLLALDPGDAYAHWNLAILYGADPSRRDDCVRHARRAAALEPSLRAEAEEIIRALTTGEMSEQ